MTDDGHRMGGRMVLPSPVKVLPPGPSFGAAEPYKEYSLPPDESPKGSKSLSHAPTGPCALFGGQDAPSHHLSPSGFNRPPQTCYSRPRKRRRKKKRATMEIFKPSLTPGYASPLAWDPEGFVTPHHKRSLCTISELVDQHDFATPKPTPSAPAKGNKDRGEGEKEQARDHFTGGRMPQQPFFCQHDQPVECVIDVEDGDAQNKCVSTGRGGICLRVLALLVMAGGIILLCAGVRHQDIPIMSAGILCCVCTVSNGALLAVCRSKRFRHNHTISPTAKAPTMSSPCSSSTKASPSICTSSTSSRSDTRSPSPHVLQEGGVDDGSARAGKLPFSASEEALGASRGRERGRDKLSERPGAEERARASGVGGIGGSGSGGNAACGGTGLSTEAIERLCAEALAEAIGAGWQICGQDEVRGRGGEGDEARPVGSKDKRPGRSKNHIPVGSSYGIPLGPKDRIPIGSQNGIPKGLGHLGKIVGARDGGMGSDRERGGGGKREERVGLQGCDPLGSRRKRARI